MNRFRWAREQSAGCPRLSETALKAHMFVLAGSLGTWASSTRAGQDVGLVPRPSVLVWGGFSCSAPFKEGTQPLRLWGVDEPEFCKPHPGGMGAGLHRLAFCSLGANQNRRAGWAQKAPKPAVIPSHFPLSPASKNKRVKRLRCWTSLKASVCWERERLCPCISACLLQLRPQFS